MGCDGGPGLIRTADLTLISTTTCPQVVDLTRLFVPDLTLNHQVAQRRCASPRHVAEAHGDSSIGCQACRERLRLREHELCRCLLLVRWVLVLAE